MIECDGLVKIYKTDEIEVMALQGLDLTVESGELMAVIGKSGSGKSTLMNMIGGLEKPSAGRIIVDDKNLADMSEEEMDIYRKQKIGFVWQKSARNLFNYLTAVENIEAAMQFSDITKQEKRARAESLLDKVGMSHKKDAYPPQMSGGEQQRVAIAVALANLPDILLADEPTGAVDSKTSAMIQDLFRQLNQELGITIIIVTHDPKLADKVDRVVMISDGKISTEKIVTEHTHDEFTVMDKAHRLQLSEDMLAAAGIDSNKVRISMEDGRLIITGESVNNLPNCENSVI